MFDFCLCNGLMPAPFWLRSSRPQHRPWGWHPRSGLSNLTASQPHSPGPMSLAHLERSPCLLSAQAPAAGSAPTAASSPPCRLLAALQHLPEPLLPWAFQCPTGGPILLFPACFQFSHLEVVSLSFVSELSGEL